MTGEQLLKAADLYAKTSRGPGNREYLVGYLGGLKVLIFKVHNPKEDGPTHTLFVTERTQRQERPSRDAERGHTTQQAVRERTAEVATEVFGVDRDQHAADLAARFDQRPPDEVPW